jgi:hypothetical protein
MEMRIMFLILALLGMYVVFTETGRVWLKKYIGLEVSPK